jgi:hypothetical protein
MAEHDQIEYQWDLRDLTLVNAHCTRWLDARGLNASWKDQIRMQFRSNIDWKERKRVKREYDEACRVWENQDQETEE